MLARQLPPEEFVAQVAFVVYSCPDPSASDGCTRNIPTRSTTAPTSTQARPNHRSQRLTRRAHWRSTRLISYSQSHPRAFLAFDLGRIRPGLNGESKRPPTADCACALAGARCFPVAPHHAKLQALCPAMS